MRWPAILFVILTTLALTLASGRGCTGTSDSSHTSSEADATETAHRP